MFFAVRHPFSLCFPVALFVAGCFALNPTSMAEPPAAAADQVNTMQTNPVIQQAIEDLAQRESIPSASIELVNYEEVTWPDASLGCPHPDMSYIQVPQDGARIILRFGDSKRIYHSGGSRPPFLCTNTVGR